MMRVWRGRGAHLASAAPPTRSCCSFTSHQPPAHCPAPSHAASPPYTTTTPATAAAAATTTSSRAVPTFWAHGVAAVVSSDAKKTHWMDSQADKRSRFTVRQRLRDDGVCSNLFPLYYVEGAPVLYVYELYVTRRVRVPAGGGDEARWGGRLNDGNRKREGTTAPSSSASFSSGKTESNADIPMVERRVSSVRAWATVRRYLQRQFACLPPHVCVRYNVYSTAPLPPEALHVPEAFRDLSWVACELRPKGRRTYHQFRPDELQELANRIAAEAMRQGAAEKDTDFAVVREHTGKMVCTARGIAADGLRVFQGVLVQAIFVDTTGATTPTAPPLGSGGGSVVAAAERSVGRHVEPSLGSSSHHPPPSSESESESSSLETEAGSRTPAPLSSRDLAVVAPTGLCAAPLRFTVHSFLRHFTFRDTPVESYQIQDASGTYLASYWQPPRRQALEVGAVYDATHVRVRTLKDRQRSRLFEFTHGTTALVKIPPTTTASSSKGALQAPKDVAGEEKEGEAGKESRTPSPAHTGTPLHYRHRQQLVLKIDAKGTIASEASLWEEIRDHFGPGPYSAETQARISRTLEGSGVVLAPWLRQDVIRRVGFPGADHSVETSAEDGPQSAHRRRQQGDDDDDDEAALDGVPRRWSRTAPPTPATLRQRLPGPLHGQLAQLAPSQPYAVLRDAAPLPLQLLHCCHDPTMTGWQALAMSVLSLLPSKRAPLLSEAQRRLEAGLRRWGWRLSDEPFASRRLSLMPNPRKEVSVLPPLPRLLRHPLPTRHPRTILILGIAGASATEDEVTRIQQTVQAAAMSFQTSLAAAVTTEVEAVHAMLRHLTDAQSGKPVDAQAAVVVFAQARESRGVRWVVAESLSRGFVVVLLPPAGTPRMRTLLCGNIRRQLRDKFEVDPLRGVRLAAEVPALAGRRALLVGVDACHTSTMSTGAVVGIVVAPERNHVLSTFWRQDVRGQEAAQVGAHVQRMMHDAALLYDGLDEVIIFQDGDTFSALTSIKTELSARFPQCGLTFLCLHKRTNIRFMYNGAASGGQLHNVVRGVVVSSLAPIALDGDAQVAPSFYLQSHETDRSTARTVQYTVHHVSPTLEIADVQLMANVAANVLSPSATKLPMPTRCAHKLADVAERLLDAVPQLESDMIPSPLNERLWFL